MAGLWLCSCTFWIAGDIDAADLWVAAWLVAFREQNGVHDSCVGLSP